MIVELIMIIGWVATAYGMGVYWFYRGAREMRKRCAKLLDDQNKALEQLSEAAYTRPVSVKGGLHHE